MANKVPEVEIRPRFRYMAQGYDYPGHSLVPGGKRQRGLLTMTPKASLWLWINDSWIIRDSDRTIAIPAGTMKPRMTWYGKYVSPELVPRHRSLWLRSIVSYQTM